MITGRSGVTSTCLVARRRLHPGSSRGQLVEGQGGVTNNPNLGFGRENRVKPSSDDLLLVEKVSDGAG